MKVSKKIYVSIVMLLLIASIISLVIASHNLDIFKVIKASATLKGSNEIPKTESNAIGYGEFIVDTKSNRLLFNIVYFGLEGSETGAHIHGPATRNQNAPVLFNLPNTQGYKTGVWNYQESLESDILKGKMYVNIHSTKYPGGEIRGQIIQNRIIIVKNIIDSESDSSSSYSEEYKVSSNTNDN